MGVRAHMAMKGAHAGEMVPCPAHIRCRVQRMSDHITFADRESLDAYNELKSLVDAAANGFMDERELKCSNLAQDMMNDLKHGQKVNERQTQMRLLTPVLREVAAGSWGGNT